MTNPTSSFGLRAVADASPAEPPVALFLFELTGNMAKPWLEAGYECWIVDLQHKPGIHREGRLVRVGADIRNGWMPPREVVDRVVFGAASPPCDHTAVSGARWFKGKGLRKLALSIDLFASAAELFEWLGCPYMLENPVSTIATYWRKPDYVFHPHHFTLISPDDNYTKTTCLWTGGGFVMPESCKDFSLLPPDDRIHKCPPSDERANIRSAAPMGFSIAVFRANSHAERIAA